MRNGLAIVPRNTPNRNVCQYLALTPSPPSSSRTGCVRSLCSLPDSNFVYFMHDERCARIDRSLILNPVSRSAGVTNVACFITALIIFGNVPAARGSLIFRVLHPLLDTLGAVKKCCTNVALRNLIVEFEIASCFQ